MAGGIPSVSDTTDPTFVAMMLNVIGNFFFFLCFFFFFLHVLYIEIKYEALKDGGCCKARKIFDVSFQDVNSKTLL